MNNSIHGVSVTLDETLTIPDGFIEVKRSWKERLFSRPFRPFKTIRLIPKYKPDPEIYSFLGQWIMHPATYARLKRRLHETLP